MNTGNKASGLFGLTVSENNGPSETIPTTEHGLGIQTDRLTVSGFVDTPKGRRGVQLDIRGELKVGKYDFSDDFKVAGFYNPHAQVSSWIGQVEGGEIILLEVDIEKKICQRNI